MWHGLVEKHLHLTEVNYLNKDLIQKKKKKQTNPLETAEDGCTSLDKRDLIEVPAASTHRSEKMMRTEGTKVATYLGEEHSRERQQWLQRPQGKILPKTLRLDFAWLEEIELCSVWLELWEQGGMEGDKKCRDESSLCRNLQAVEWDRKILEFSEQNTRFKLFTVASIVAQMV